MIETADRETSPRRGSSLARSTAVMSIGTVISRATGVVRLAVIAATLGIAETRLHDTYNLANTVPNVIYELVLGGVITSVFVPLFVELREREDAERAWQVISAVINVSLLVLSAIAVIGIVAAPWIARFYAARLSGEEVILQQQVITFLLRLFMPQVVLYGVYFLIAAVMNSYKVFGPQMFTPIVNNLVVIAAFLAFGHLYGFVTLETVETSHLWLIGLGTTASVAPMGLLLVRYLRKLGRYRLTLSLDHPSVRKLGRLSVFAVGFVVANQIGYVLIQWLANAQPGAFTAYIAAFTFFLMPIGLFAWSITTALVPAMSEHALHARWDLFGERVSTGIRALIFVMLPAAAGYALLSRPIVRVLLQHGIATAESTDLVAGVLRLLSLGLLQFAIFQLLVRAFYSTQDVKTPFLINAALIAANMALNVAMFGWLGAEGLGAGHAVAYSFGVIVQLAVLSKRASIQLGRILNSLARAAAATAGMAVVVWLVASALDTMLAADSLPSQATMLVAAIAAGALTYLLLASALRLEELGYVRDLVLRRGRTAPPEPIPRGGV